eukprot:365455-Chlamydomonas_euryale.AAC.23
MWRFGPGYGKWGLMVGSVFEAILQDADAEGMAQVRGRGLSCWCVRSPKVQSLCRSECMPKRHSTLQGSSFGSHAIQNANPGGHISCGILFLGPLGAAACAG